MGKELLGGGVVQHLLIQVDKALTEESSKVVQLLEWLNQHPVLGWGLAAIALVAMAVAAIAKLTGNLDKIFSFRTKYLSRANTELSERQLDNFRQQMLQQMKTDVAKRLEDSLHNLVRVDLEQEEQRHQVGRRKEPLVDTEMKRPWPFTKLIQRGLTVFRNNSAIEPLAPAKKTYAIFNRTDIGRRLLILGEPGAGKTTELITVTQRLIEEAIADSAQPIPLIFELSSWTPSEPILSWLSQQLKKSYGVSRRFIKPLVRQWIQQNRLLLLLDGLDELGENNQVACIKSLEIFLSQHPALSVIVCCRRKEYEKGKLQLRQLRGAIYLQAIRPKQIQQYLHDLKQEKLWKQIQMKPNLLELAQSPLFLTMLVVAYQDQPIRDEASLFNAYIQKQLHDISHRGVYRLGKEMSHQQGLHYIGWLARQLKEKQETEFLIGNLQPNWLQGRQKKVYRLVIGLVFGPIYGIISALMLWLTFAATGPINTHTLSRLNIRVTFDPQVGLIIGLVFGLSIGLLGGLSGDLDVIEPKEKLSWTLDDGSSVGLWRGLFLGPFIAKELTNESIEQKQVPNQGIKKSLQNGLLVGMTGLLWGGLIAGFGFLLTGWLEKELLGESPLPLMEMLRSVEQRNEIWDMLRTELVSRLTSELADGLTGGLIGGLTGGLIGGLTGGLMSVIQHFILRICLTQTGNVPWNYAQFLEYAVRHRFIQRTGGRYRFVHDLLRGHFAHMTQQQQAKLAQPSR